MMMVVDVDVDVDDKQCSQPPFPTISGDSAPSFLISHTSIQKRDSAPFPFKAINVPS